MIGGRGAMVVLVGLAGLLLILAIVSGWQGASRLTSRSDAVLGDDIRDRVLPLDAVEIVDHGSSLNRAVAVREGLWQGEV